MTDDDAVRRRRRIERLKKIIKATILTAIVVPFTAAIIFLVLFIHTKKQLSDLQGRYDDLLESVKQLESDSLSYIEDVDYSTSEIETSPRENTEAVQNTQVSQNTEAENTEDSMRKVYLTFDDGPSSNTDRILDILDTYGVKATFFVVGKDDETSVAAYSRIVEDGHTLGMHSYSHKYSELYASDEAFAEDFKKIQEYLYDLTGVWSRYYRFPGGSSNTASTVDMDDLIGFLNDQDITYYDWNIVSGDASGTYISADKIYDNCMSGLEQHTNAFILMHDASNKNTTVEALPKIIEAIQAMDDTEILPITDETVPVQHKTIENQ